MKLRVPQSCGFVRSDDILNTLFLHMLQTNDHHTYSRGDLTRGFSTNKLT